MGLVCGGADWGTLHVEKWGAIPVYIAAKSGRCIDFWIGGGGL